MTINCRTLADELGVALPTGTLIQLVNLGANGVFDPILLNDDVTGLNRWVSGDDTVLNLVYQNGFTDPPTAGDSPSTAAFDLNASTGTTGQLFRRFVFGDNLVPEGTKIGIRWFPDLAAADFSTTTLQDGQWYGQFTRQTGLLYEGSHNTSPWAWPSEDPSPNITLDLLRTVDNAPTGLDPVTAGYAQFQVIIPEPATIGLSLMGAIGLLGFRRRRL